MARAAVLVIPLLLSGCVSELLGPEEATTRTTACAVLDAQEFEELHLEVHQPASARAGGSTLLDTWSELSGRSGDAVSLRLRDGPDHDGPWTPAALQDWISERPVLERGRVTLHVVWVPALDGSETVLVWAPGIVAINTSAVDAGAVQTGLAPGQVGLALLLHGFGHALGVVNAGIPMHNQDITGREGPPHHEPVAGSVMNVDWHRVASMPSNATLAYSDQVMEDWRRAIAPGGACVE